MTELEQEAFDQARAQLIGGLQGRVLELSRLVDRGGADKATREIWETMRERGVPTYVEQLKATRILLRTVELCTER